MAYLVLNMMLQAQLHELLLLLSNYRDNEKSEGFPAIFNNALFSSLVDLSLPAMIMPIRIFLNKFFLT